MASPKTFAVLLKDGTPGRAVLLNKNNVFKLATWTGGEGVLDHNKDSTIKNVQVKFFQYGGKQKRVANVGDIIIKTADGFTTFKAGDFDSYTRA